MQPGTLSHPKGRGTFERSVARSRVVAVVAVGLSEPVAHLHAPMMADGTMAGLVLAVPGVRLMAVVARKSQIDHRWRRRPTPEEIRMDGLHGGRMGLFIGLAAEASASEAFVRRTFPGWARMLLRDEASRLVPGETSREGLSPLPSDS